MHSLMLTCNLLELVAGFSKLQEKHPNAPVLVHLVLRNIFQSVAFVSQQQQCIYPTSVG